MKSIWVIILSKAVETLYNIPRGCRQFNWLIACTNNSLGCYYSHCMLAALAF